MQCVSCLFTSKKLALFSIEMSSGSVGADMILANARSVEFNDIFYKNITPSDGNCWYHAVLDQIRRPDILHLFSANLLLDHRLSSASYCLICYIRK